MKKTLAANSVVHLILVILLNAAFFAGCKKSNNTDVYAAPPDLTTKITSSVSGFVTDENDAAVKNATVQFGSAILYTDKYGYFEAKNIEVVKDAATVTITKPGYFKGIKTYMAATGKSAFFRIKLIPKTITGTVSANTGGAVSLSNGLSVNLPANAVVNAATNAAYTGTINVSSYWINPTATDLPGIMPGDLRGVNTDGNVQLLTTYGMAAVELTGSGGELLQIATGKKATLTLPIPAALSSSAPATIPLWHFDEASGLWKQEGSATKVGNNYVGEVAHFTFWNWDLPNAIVPFSLTVLNSNGQSIPNAFVKISLVNYPASYGYGYTDANGFLNGFISANAQLLLEVKTTSCNSASYTLNFTSNTAPVSLGNIIVPATNVATVQGTVTNCSNSPVTNGYVYVLENNNYFRYALDNTGTFNFLKVVCGNSTPVVLIGEDVTTLQQSAPVAINLVAGINNAGNIKACGFSAQEYYYFTLDGANYLMTAPQDSIEFSDGFIYATQYQGNTKMYSYLEFQKPGITVNSNQAIVQFVTSKITSLVSVPANLTLLHVTEYGPVGQFAAGNFSGSFVEISNGTVINHNISGSFRARRG